ncbi:MAG TPA: cobaltochelatase subunit CobN [Alphaproteobacteria bacterium]|nr:cobaltochelatase subunit CobN [Alphaproteobacteria bacterium]
MHMLRVETRSIDGTAEAVDLDQTPADIVALSFTDTDLSVLAAAWEANRDTLPSLRLANLSALRHPFSVDLYLEKVVAKAKFVLVRLLGGKDYWRYGVDELAMLARERGVRLAIVPGDHREDARLDEASTLPAAELRRIGAYFSAGGPENIAACLRFAAGSLSGQPIAPEPAAVPAFGMFASPGAPVTSQRALILFYRAWMLAADTAPVTALADALSERGFAVTAVYVTSLKDEAVVGPLRDLIAAEAPDVILNLTAFSASVDGGGSVLDRADAPVFQLVLSGGGRAQWAESQRGLGPADLAMNVVLPELDGRILAGAISFKGETERSEALEFTRLAHDPEPAGIAHAADLAAAWARLRRTRRSERRLACVLSDYPAKGGRTGYAVGLDTPRSVIAIAGRLAREGYDSCLLQDQAALVAALSTGETTAILTVPDYERMLAGLPASLAEEIRTAWGDPSDDAAVRDGIFHIRTVRAGNLLVAVQPDRGNAPSRKTDYHSPLVPPRHGYVAFYLWLRHVERVHAVIQCGTHGTLEWLPGKAVALSDACAPRALLGPMPLIYPFIVNNPGEAAQAKRRTSAVTVGHLTPPLVAAGVHGAAAELEGLFDEYAEAQSLDPRRAARLADIIMARAADTGLAAESGVVPGADSAEALMKLDAWLCDLKDMRVGDGLHVFGQAPEPLRRAQTATSLAALSGADTMTIESLLDQCGEAEMCGLIAALDGKFVAAGPAGAPARGRTDVLPTGRNLYGIDPRAVPTRTAWEIGRRTAEELLTRHVQDHGEWPRSVVLDIWGSASMRTGGDDLAQAFALMGVQPRWDAGSNRVSGFDILPLAAVGRPRVDVTLRISGLFRDVFPGQITLFDAAAQAVAEQDEAPEDNPLGASVREGDAGLRVFGAAPGQYGVGVSRLLNSGDWQERQALGDAYLDATSHAYGADAEGVPAAPDFRARVAEADAFVHVQDLADQDVLGADAFAKHEGGFAAAAASLGNKPALYHADTTTPDTSKIRTLREEVARALRGRATNPRWIAGQMRHGYRGAAEIAESVDNFFAYAALTDVTESRQFDLLFDATLGDEQVRAFLLDANLAAARGMADKFDQAVRRGFWTTRRNSTSAILAALREAAE